MMKPALGCVPLAPNTPMACWLSAIPKLMNFLPEQILGVDWRGIGTSEFRDLQSARRPSRRHASGPSLFRWLRRLEENHRKPKHQGPRMAHSQPRSPLYILGCPTDLPCQLSRHPLFSPNHLYFGIGNFSFVLRTIRWLQPGELVNQKTFPSSTRVVSTWPSLGSDSFQAQAP